MYELLIENEKHRVHLPRLREMIGESTGQIRLVSPYVTISDDLIEILKGRRVQLITSTDLEDMVAGVSSSALVSKPANRRLIQKLSRQDAFPANIGACCSENSAGYGFSLTSSVRA